MPMTPTQTRQAHARRLAWRLAADPAAPGRAQFFQRGMVGFRIHVFFSPYNGIQQV